ncbi:P-II family nitrogen regulator [Mariprofundus ferrooxydans]|uniref:Nitrogen regulatory protein PII n=1 Tax=Mariprofundus ferrooxydans PV-1 TaxID=314345 RepID=Q0F1K0_9PROT|nr:P-II family nitrogen regulator [Mariprofundus ferrooxydans]EAU55191.1 Nitrogen regulatory protein PII [Mariprofundus ferrooxydans PV-1]
MKYKKVMAIIISEKLEEVEKALNAMHVSGLSVTQVRGYGEYHNFYRHDMTCRHARIEIFCQTSEANAIARCIMDAAHTGMSGDGIVGILPVEQFYHIRTRSEPCVDSAD